MKKFLLSAVALSALAAPAFAADMPARTYSKAPVYTPPQAIYNWTGFYIGGHVGGAFSQSNSLEGNDGRFLGGVQGGFDYQFAPSFVAGIEAQYSWMDRNTTNFGFPGATVVSSAGANQLGSVTGRLGYTWGPALLYAKGGYAWKGSNDIGVSNAGLALPFATSGNAKDGYTVGGGLEYMFTQNWSAKVEYQYYNFGNTTVSSLAIPGGSASYNNDEHTVKAGLNYRFGWGGPVVAKY